MERTSAHFHVVGLQYDAALRAPIIMERQDERLKAERLGVGQDLLRKSGFG
jgi:hypothetical protein